MQESLQGLVALVTGGGKGIGREIAIALAKAGARVAISGRHRHSLDDAISIIGSDCLALEMDVRNPESVRSGVDQVAKWGGKLDILVNNAGIGLLDTPLMDTTLDAWRDVLETNLTGAFMVTQAAWPHLVESKGQILNVSSIAGSQGFVGASAYCASKFGLNGFAEVLKKEGSSFGIRVLAICPGAVDTDIWEADWASADTRSRMMTPDQIGGLAATMLATPRNIDLGSWIVLNAADPWSD